MRQAFNEIGGAAVEAERMDRRLGQWKSFYRQRQADAGFVKTSVSAENTGAIQLAQAFKTPSLGNRPAAEAPAWSRPALKAGTTVVPLDKRFGIKLAVTPRFLSKGQVQIKVDAQRTSLNANSDNPKVAYQIVRSPKSSPTPTLS